MGCERAEFVDVGRVHAMRWSLRFEAGDRVEYIVVQVWCVTEYRSNLTPDERAAEVVEAGRMINNRSNEFEEGVRCQRVAVEL